MSAPQYENQRPTGWPDPSGLAGRHRDEPPGEPSDEAAITPPLEPAAPAPPARAGAWRRWRRSRPFWGGLLVILGGSWIFLTERPPMRLAVHLGMQGLAGLAIPFVMVLCGLLLWFNPTQRLFYSILAVLSSLGSFITSNLGGFIIGMLLGIVGGSLAFGWALPPPTPTPAQSDLAADGDLPHSTAAPDQA